MSRKRTKPRNMSNRKRTGATRCRARFEESTVGSRPEADRQSNGLPPFASGSAGRAGLASEGCARAGRACAEAQRRDCYRDRASRNDRENRNNAAIQRPFGGMKGAAALLAEYERLERERRRLPMRLAYLRLRTPRPMCERLAERILRRYEEEIDTLPAEIAAVAVRLERMGVRV